MAKIDELKERLTTQRLYLSLAVGLQVILVGALISRFREGALDLFYWIGIDLSVILLIMMSWIFKVIERNTKKIGEL
jgi:hypothetical protein